MAGGAEKAVLEVTAAVAVVKGASAETRMILVCQDSIGPVGTRGMAPVERTRRVQTAEGLETVGK